MAVGAAVPLPRPQRRDQHHHRQPQLGHGPAHQVRQRPDPRPRRARPTGQPGRLRLIEHGQHAGADGYRRHRPVPRRAHAGTASLAERRDHGRRPACLLRIQLHAHGAVGRPGRYRHDRRSPCGLPARPQRPAPGALGHHPQWLHHHRLGNRRMGLPAGRRGCQRPRGPWADLCRGYRNRADPRYRRHRQPPQVAPSVQALVAPACHAHPGHPERRPGRGQLRR